MDQSLSNRLILGTVFVIIMLLIICFSKFSKLTLPVKVFLLFILLFFLQGSIRVLLLLKYYDLVEGTTKGLSHASKQSTTYIDYEFKYRNKVRTGSVVYRGGAKTKNGKYYVRVAKIIPAINAMDFSMPVPRNKDKIR